MKYKIKKRTDRAFKQTLGGSRHLSPQALGLYQERQHSFPPQACLLGLPFAPAAVSTLASQTPRASAPSCSMTDGALMETVKTHKSH